MPSSQKGKSSMTIRCTSEEYSIIESKANDLGMKISEYIRYISVNSDIEVRIKPSPTE